MSDVITLIPARLNSTRLPNKLLLDVNGKTVLERVCENIKKTIKTDICVACSDDELMFACKKYDIPAVLTDPNLPSGTDRIASALNQIDPKSVKYNIVVNFQGDGINVNPKVNLPLIEMIKKNNCDIVTCGVLFKKKEDIDNPSNVKIIIGLKENETEGKVLYFTRSNNCPYIRDPEKVKNKNMYHHIGIYVYKSNSLKKLVSLPVGVLEEIEQLEQLRALENNMTIRVKIVKNEEIKINLDAPADINTIEDLEISRKYIK